jgi:hypothetical protein
MHVGIGRPRHTLLYLSSTPDDAEILELSEAVLLLMGVARATAYLKSTNIPVCTCVCYHEVSNEGLLDALSQTVDIRRQNLRPPRPATEVWQVSFELLLVNNCTFVQLLKMSSMQPEVPQPAASSRRSRHV